MKHLKDYIKESILDDIDTQIENTDNLIMIKNWLNANVLILRDNKLKFDFSTTPVTVNYDDDIQYKNKNITSLTNGMFQWGEVEGYFSCSNCEKLKSLEGAPKEVEGNFNCERCEKLKSLEGAPNKVGGGFKCSYCHSLESLKGAPKEVGGIFDCSYCRSLKSFEGAPKEVGEEIYCERCGRQFTVDYVEKYCKTKRKIYC